MPTQAERTGATTGLLLDAARALFGSRGFAQTSTEDVVRATGLTRGALYHHFGSKEGLFTAVLDREEERLAEAIAVAGESRPDAASAIKAGCRVFLDACLEPAYYRIALVDAPAVLGPETVREIEAARSFRLLASALRGASGGRGSNAVDARASVLYGAVCESGRYAAVAANPRAALRAVLAELDAVVDALLAAAPTSRSPRSSA